MKALAMDRLAIIKTSKGLRRLPVREPTRWRRQAGKLLLIPVAPLLLWIGATTWFTFPGWHKQRTDLLTYSVHPTTIQRKVTERGTLAAGEFKDVICRVKARDRSNTIATYITWVIEDGTLVRRGDLLAQLDASGFEEERQQQQLKVLQARSDWLQSEANYQVVESQNLADLKTAGVNLSLAELDLAKYVDGDYVQLERDIEGRLSQAEFTLEMWLDRIAWSQRMATRGFVSSNSFLSEQSRFRTAQVNLGKIREERRLLQEHTGRRTRTELQNKLAEAKRAKLRAENQARAKEIQADIDRKAKKSVYEQQLKLLREIDDEIELCTIRSPADGIVVHYVNEESRYSSRTNIGVVAQGEPVREGQKLMYVSNMSRMVVQTRIHESQLATVDADMIESTGFSDAVQASLALAPNIITTLGSVFAWEEIRDQYRDREQQIYSYGDRALITVHALPDVVLHGRVKSIASMPSSQEWRYADVKVYPTVVTVDNPVDGLKPGMSVDVTILSGTKAENVLAVPIQAVMGALRRDTRGICYVLTGAGPQKREVELGSTDDTLIEVKSGLMEGEQVVLNPRTVMQDTAD